MVEATLLTETKPTIDHIQSLTINNQDIKMYGDIQNPLFLVNDIMNLLGYDKNGSNRFYKDNKQNERYVKWGQIASTPQELQIRFKNSSTQQISFFTEFGLYRCLFQSQKPIAIEFQEQVAQLLKDIRSGNIKLMVQKECEFTNIVQRQNNELITFITQNSKLQKQIEELKTYIEENKEEYVIYDQTVVETGEQYRGITNNLKRRNSQHRISSCNPGLRQAIEQGKEIKTTILRRFRSLSRKECRSIERAAILDIPIKQRLNKRIPGGMCSNTAFSHKSIEEILSQVQNQFQQQQYEENKSKNRISAKQSVVTNETVETDTNISQDSQGKLNTIIEQSCDDVMKCSNCKKTVEVRNQRYKTCQQCRQQNKLSKQKKASEQVRNGCKLCPRCSCVRPDSYFILKDKQMKTCANCRERNHKTTKAIKIHNDINLGKICIICHKINTNLDKKSCNECLEKKKQSRIKNLCIHQRDPYYCAIGDCGLQNSIKGVCLKHGSRLLKGICKKCQINNNKAINQNIGQHLNQDTNTNVNQYTNQNCNQCTDQDDNYRANQDVNQYTI